MDVKTLDVRGSICPDPLTLTMGEMETMQQGDQLKVLLDASTALETISRWAERAGHRVVEIRDAGAAQWEMVLQKG